MGYLNAIKSGYRACEGLFAKAPLKHTAIPEGFLEAAKAGEVKICPNFLEGAIGDVASFSKTAKKETEIIASDTSKAATKVTEQAKRAEERIKEIKSMVYENEFGDKYTYEEMVGFKKNQTEDDKLGEWYNFIEEMKPLSKSKKNCYKEVEKCFEKENIRKIEFFKNLSDKEIEFLLKSPQLTREQLIAVITGHKPAFDGILSEDAVIDFAKAIKGTKYENEFLAFNRKSAPYNFCILNKKQVREIVEKNKEIYCRELGLDINTPTETVYQKWLNCIKNESPTAEKPLAFGLTLGYPKNSSIIYTLKMGFLKDLNGGLEITQFHDKKYRDLLLSSFRHKDSPFANYSEEFKKDFEHYVKAEDFRDFMNPFEERLISSFKLYGSDSVDMKRIREAEIDFVNNFRMEQLF